MEEIQGFEFALIQHHKDYLEFSVSYQMEWNFWTTEGIAWVSESATNYYLRSLHLNKWPAASLHHHKAGITLKQHSMKFQCQTLEDLTLSNINRHWHQRRLRKPARS